ncbi:MAG: DNA-3-methyladenine glycosylase family protein [Planctomycetota bacterium]
MPTGPQQTRIPLNRPFELELALFGHGWVDLPPFQWIPETKRVEFALRAGRLAVGVALAQKGRNLEIRTLARRPLARGELEEIRGRIARMLRLGEDYSAFWNLCGKSSGRAWVARRGAGRLLRAPTLFEDLMKILFTTNCTWAATRLMCRRLVEALGTRTPLGNRTFPGYRVCARQDEAFFREVVRAGYRAASALELACAFAECILDEQRLENPALPTSELRNRLGAIPGFGPYAVGQALRLLGRYDDLALDSWVRAEMARRKGRRKPPSDRSIEREYHGFGSWRGLVLWMDLTARWHGEEKTT